MFGQAVVSFHESDLPAELPDAGSSAGLAACIGRIVSTDRWPDERARPIFAKELETANALWSFASYARP